MVYIINIGDKDLSNDYLLYSKQLSKLYKPLQNLFKNESVMQSSFNINKKSLSVLNEEKIYVNVGNNCFPYLVKSVCYKNNKHENLDIVIEKTVMDAPELNIFQLVDLFN